MKFLRKIKYTVILIPRKKNKPFKVYYKVTKYYEVGILRSMLRNILTGLISAGF